jgi:arsenite methyltransferase
MFMSDRMTSAGESDVRSMVRERYGAIAEQGGGCCTPTTNSGCCGGATGDAIQLDSIAALYEDPDVESLPAGVTDLSLGCGDPVTLASLQPGQTVLDLGAGGGIDCFLAAKKVGPAGRVIGVDMTPSMIDRARRNQQQLGADNVEFRLGEIEHLPVADNSVDVILSNCVINLSPDKAQVFHEAYRVLKPGGRLAVSDIVTGGPLPEAVKNDLAAWAGCVAGALDVADYVAAIKAAGFVDVELTPVYWESEMVEAAVAQLDPVVAEQITGSSAGQGDLETAVFSAKITARKPAMAI